MSTLRKQHHEQNRLSWNAATRAHNSHKRDQAAFLRGGGSTLNPEELGLLGDLAGQKLLHLQCNSGQDTLSLAARGAQVTGVDISDEAISFARALSADSGIPGVFERADVYDWLAEAPAGSFDVVFCSYGALLWLSDLATWGRGIAKVLRPGGRFVTVDSHPFMMVLGEDLQLQYPYGGGAEVLSGGVNDYVAEAGQALTPSGWEEGEKGFTNPHADVSFQWSMGDILNALTSPGLHLERLEEYSFTKWRAFRKMVPGPEGNFVLPPEIPQIPMMFGLRASKR